MSEKIINLVKAQVGEAQMTRPELVKIVRRIVCDELNLDNVDVATMAALNQLGVELGTIEEGNRDEFLDTTEFEC